MVRVRVRVRVRVGVGVGVRVRVRVRARVKEDAANLRQQPVQGLLRLCRVARLHGTWWLVSGSVR